MFRVLLIIIVAYYLVKWMVRLILPHFIKQQMDNYQNQSDKQNPYFQQKKQRREGSVTVEKVQPNPDKSKDDGDYVDFEEIK